MKQAGEERRFRVGLDLKKWLMTSVFVCLIGSLLSLLLIRKRQEVADCVQSANYELATFSKVHSLKLSPKDYCQCVIPYWATGTRLDRSLNRACICEQIQKDNASYTLICQDLRKFATDPKDYEISPIAIKGQTVRRITIDPEWRKMIPHAIDDQKILEFFKSIDGQQIGRGIAGNDGALVFYSDFNLMNETFELVWLLKVDEIKVFGLNKKLIKSE